MEIGLRAGRGLREDHRGVTVTAARQQLTPSLRVLEGDPGLLGSRAQLASLVRGKPFQSLVDRAAGVA